MNSPWASQILQSALALHRQGDLRAAAESYRQVLGREPNNADALYYLAVAAVQEGRFEEGIAMAQRSMQAAPQARAANLIGQAYHRSARLPEAIANFDRAIELQPDFADAHGNRANALAEMGRLEDSLAGFDRALAIRDNSPEDWANRGAVLQDLDRLQEALTNYERAIALRPEFAGAHYNRANILRDLAQIEDARGRAQDQVAERLFDEAYASYAKAIELKPDFAEAYFGRGLVHLLRGKWDAGFRDYEYRLAIGQRTFVPLSHPRWIGETLQGERLVLVAEQGLGDAINFCRFAPLLAARGLDVAILCRKAMQPLLSRLGNVKVAASLDELMHGGRSIRWLPLMSVAGVLGVRPDRVPAQMPYLSAPPDRLDRWAARIGTQGCRIGINWVSGHSDNRHFLKRNIPLEEFAPLAALPEVRLFSLQKGAAAGDIGRVAFGDRITMLDIDPDPDAGSFLDTASVMQYLDLVISCDTSVAHLAGALGRPVFTALPAVADWRWLLGRDDSPWYPTMRLFRQRARGEWGDVFARITQGVRSRGFPKTSRH